MDVVIVFLAIVGGLVGLDVAALRWGADSRVQPSSDNRRSVTARWI